MSLGFFGSKKKNEKRKTESNESCTYYVRKGNGNTRQANGITLHVYIKQNFLGRHLWQFFFSVTFPFFSFLIIFLHTYDISHIFFIFHCEES